ncbi:heterokaryon incompatibility protein-domain-containing protein [Neurospora crassa]|nr:heterokaryon incompatibility protein-domain-containing protein [Neurospora crassa]
MEREYTALSYVWGDPKVTSPIAVNGVPFYATHNLCAALKRIRSKSNLPTTLWVDAICINQSDKDEKSSQVQLRTNIYHNALLVTVWLGESDKYTDEAIVLIKLTAYLQRSLEVKGERHYTANYLLRTVSSALSKSDLRSLALLKFFSRPWWSRVWVVQEVIVSRRANIICGTKEIPWDDLRRALRCWWVLRSFSDKSEHGEAMKKATDDVFHKTSLALFLNLFNERDREDKQILQNEMGSFPGLSTVDGPNTGLEGTILAGHSFESTDPRDKVYAWLGIYQGHGLNIVPDYSASTAQVYGNAVKAIMELTGSLSLVALTGGLDNSQDPLPGLPSWAPDLRHGNHRKSSWGPLMAYDASASETARATFSPDGKVLVADSLLLDHIELTDAEHTAMGAEWLSREFFTALVWPARRFSFLPDGDPKDRYSQINNLQRVERLWTGFTAYFGYMDRLHDVAQWCKEHEPRLYDQMVVWSVDLGTRQSPSPNRLPPRPHIQDEENIPQFCRLWGLPEDERPLYVKCKNWRPDSQNCDKKETTYDDVLKFAQRADLYTREKTFFITKQGYLGSGTHKIGPGDSLAIIRGCRMPLVIRKHSMGDGSFEVLGQCYAGALMDGEPVENTRKRGELEWKSLSFR